MVVATGARSAASGPSCIGVAMPSRWRKHPDARHDKKDWSPGDAIREFAAGESLGFRGAIIRIRGDFMEYAKTLGLPTRASHDAT